MSTEPEGMTRSALEQTYIVNQIIAGLHGPDVGITAYAVGHHVHVEVWPSAAEAIIGVSVPLAYNGSGARVPDVTTPTEKSFDEKLRRIIGEGMGEASMCWAPIPVGVFDPEQAIEVVERTVLAIEVLMAESSADWRTRDEALSSHPSWADTLLSNVSHGDWTSQSDEWITAFETWRNEWFTILSEMSPEEPYDQDSS